MKKVKTANFDPDNCECWVCHRTFPYFGTESPMVSERIWKIVGYDEPVILWKYSNGDRGVGGGFLCKDCMEKRLGRPLQYEDLKDVEAGRKIPFNEEFIAKYFPDKVR